MNVDTAQKVDNTIVTKDIIKIIIFFLSRIDHGKLKKTLTILFPKSFLTSFSNLLKSIFEFSNPPFCVRGDQILSISVLVLCFVLGVISFINLLRSILYSLILLPFFKPFNMFKNIADETLIGRS